MPLAPTGASGGHEAGRALHQQGAHGAEMISGDRDDTAGGEALALLGHDLRAALGDMRAGLSLLEGQAAPPELQGLLARCIASADGLSRLIDQSVLVCLGQGSPMDGGVAPIDTAAFLNSLRQKWVGLAADSGHSFQLITAGALPDSFLADRTALDRILGNLIGNALRHTPPGPVRLVFKISQDELLLLSVDDDGPGFPARHLALIERDFALPPEARREGGGLGLQSVKRLVQAMGGRCHARNKPEGGAEVGVCLPLSSGQGAEDGGARQATPPDLTGTRILVADDSAAARELTAALGTIIGAQVETVADGAAAMRALSEGGLPDVVILDDEMPGTSGLDVLRWLRRQEGAVSGLPVLALTSHIGPAELAALRLAGANEVLAKPLLCPIELGRAILRAQGLPERGSPTAAPRQDSYQALQKLQQIAGPVAAKELFARMEEDLQTAKAGLSAAVAAGDLGAIRAHSHVIIALAGTAGDSALHEDAVVLNGMANDQHPAERVVALARRLERPIEGLIDTVRGFARAQTSDVLADLGPP